MAGVLPAPFFFTRRVRLRAVGLRDVPRQKFLNAIDGMLGDALQHLAQIGFRVETVQFGRANQAIDCGSAFATGIGSREQIVLPPQGHGPQRPFGGVVVDLDVPSSK